MIFAYADPPYIGRAKYYKSHPDYAGEVDQGALIKRLVSEYPDGWALSCSSPSLRELLPLCPGDVRVLAWVKPFASWKRGQYPAYAWEPVIMRGGRKLGYPHTVRDWVAANITLKRGLVGAKPEAFCVWLFKALGMQPSDELHDLFPGSGAVTEAWQHWAGALEKPDLQQGALL
jgi:hypothetical protein